MAIPVFETKLHIPRTRPKLVPRRRLVKRLNEGLHRKLTLISAPAGFGKTTLVSAWVDCLQTAPPDENERDYQVAWLGLDEGDNDLTRFLTYLVAALNLPEKSKSNQGDGVLGMLQSSQSPPEDVLAALINEITALPEGILLALDDYHLIEAQSVHEALAFLLEHLPTHVHLVLATRVDPQLPLARMRARDQLNELRAADLRFSSSEATTFLNQVMGLTLSAAEVSALDRRTEGWIAGLQLAALSMQGKEDPAALIQSFTGSHRFVLDYLIEEVLGQQTEDIQSFLLRTSILERLSGPLCDVLTGREDGQETLQRLERANLFLIPLDEERGWFRYHHLFVDLLNQRLQQIYPNEVPELHLRASQWYEQNRFADEAILHALRALHFERAADLIEAWIDALWARGEHKSLQRWLDGLPESVLLSRPYLCVYQARYQCNRGQPDAAERTLDAVDAAVDSMATDAPSAGKRTPIAVDPVARAKLSGRAAATRALISSYHGDVQGIVKHASRALEELPGEDLSWRSSTAVVLGNAYGFQGDMNAAYEARFQALQTCEAAGDIYSILVAHLELAITLRAQGRLRRTIEICQQQMRLAEKRGLSRSRTAGWLLSVWGEALAERNDLKGGLARARTGFELTRLSGDLQLTGWSFMCLFRTLISSGDLAGAEAVFEKMQDLAQESALPPWVAAQLSTWRARLWLAQGNTEPSSRWAYERGFVEGGELNLPEVFDYFLLSDYVVLARVLIAQSQLEEATRLLARLLEAAEAGGRTAVSIEVMILQALTYQAGGELDRATSSLGGALALAEPEGFVRIFVDEGPPMARLLRLALNSREMPQDYVRRLLEACLSTEPVKDGLPTAHAEQYGLIEPLSEREIEVLELIADGLTNREIAGRLYLALNTVKVHTRNIYGKLGVNNRMQAVAKGRDLGIVSPS